MTLRQTIVRPSVEIGGVTVPDNLILFSGLAPQFVGLYQINLAISTGIRASDRAPIVIHQGPPHPASPTSPSVSSSRFIFPAA